MTPISLGYSLLGLVLFFFATVWYGCSRYNKSEATYCLLSFGYSCLWGIGVILLSLRGLISDWLSYSLSSFFIIAGFVCLLRGVESLYNLSTSRLSTAGILGISGLLLLFVGPSEEYQPYRLTVLGTASAYCCVHAFKKAFFPIYHQHGSKVTAYIGGIAAFAIFLWLLRLPMGSLAPADLNIVSYSSFNLSAMYLSWFIAICFQGSVLFLMITRILVKLEQLSTLDYLTGAENRLGLNKRWHSMSADQEVVLLILDIDHFKKVNDTYGHDLGDEVLKLVVRRIKRCIRNNDVLSRYGGEEFIALMPGIDLDKGYELAERIRTTIEKEPLKLSNHKLQVTVSIGIVSLTDEVDDIEMLITKADQALYQAKENGRNQTVIAPP